MTVGPTYFELYSLLTDESNCPPENVPHWIDMKALAIIEVGVEGKRSIT